MGMTRAMLLGFEWGAEILRPSESSMLEQALHTADLRLLGYRYFLGKTPVFSPVAAFQYSLGHHQGGLVVWDHQPQELLVRLFGGGTLQASQILGRDHTRHPTLGGVPHPTHRGLSPADRQVPDGEPALHLADLGLLGKDGVGR